MSNSGYLPDPEEEIQDAGYIASEPVKAVSKEDAERLCKDKAKEYNVELVDVEYTGKSWWDCIFGQSR